MTQALVVFIWFKIILLLLHCSTFTARKTQLFSAFGAILLSIELAPFLEDEDCPCTPVIDNYKNSSGDEIANVLVNDDIAHT